jgi:hypothetical protein
LALRTSEYRKGIVVGSAPELFYQLIAFFVDASFDRLDAMIRNQQAQTIGALLHIGSGIGNATQSQIANWTFHDLTPASAPDA